MNQILTKARKSVIPTKKIEHEKNSVARLAFNLVTSQAKKYSEILDVEFGGSYAKGTWISAEQGGDIDIFIKFKKETAEKKFIEVSKKVGFQALKKFHPYVKYSDHPYVEAKIKTTKVNVVPCYNVEKGDWKSAADRTHFHTEFMLESLSGEMKNDVRLLKKFLMSNEIYGAEIAKQGFSGYVAEVLIWSFGSFEKVLKEFAKMNEGQIIGKSTKEFDTVISIMDPIDSNRNLAAAISEENIGRFVLASRGFLKKPSMNFFRSRKRRVKSDILKNVILVRFQFKTRSPDIIWGQIKRASSALNMQLKLAGFKVIRNTAITDEANDASLIFLLDSLVIPELFVREGPEYFNENDASSFVKKNKKTSKLLWVANNRRICVLDKRRNSEAKQFLTYLLSKNLNNSGIPAGIKNDIKKFKILTGNMHASKSIKEAIAEMASTDEILFSSN